MRISTHAIVSNSDMIKSYKACREKADKYGKIFILKNNQPDAVLISANEYEKLCSIIEYIDTMDDAERAAFIEKIPSVVIKMA